MMKFLIYLIVFSISLSVQAQAQPKMTKRADQPVDAWSGQKKLLATLWYIREDCSTVREFNISVGTLPENGIVDLLKQRHIVTLGMAEWARNDRDLYKYKTTFACIGKEIDVINLYYKSKDGFKGIDRFTYLSTYPPHGDQWLRTFVISNH